ncbi:MAG: inorganic phosphate transporter [Chlamydiales bacterium]|nr:inorganic phosphate transporter [Chlamydiales bacterium]
MNEIVLLIIIFGLIFDYTNGFHDAANVVATVVATRVLAPLTAIVLAGILNTIGATQVSGVAKTITSGLISPEFTTPLMVLAAVVGAITWNLITWHFGLPSSSSYALIGGLVGAAWVAGGPKLVLWGGIIGKVLIPLIVSPIVGFFLAFLLMKLLARFAHGRKNEKLFGYLQMGSASLVALSHGFNDAQKSMALITMGLFSTGLVTSLAIPIWVILLCALMMGLGTASGGFRIIKTVGYDIAKITPVQGFATELSASCVILTASFLGMPLSSTQMIVGSVTGVGAAKSAKTVKWLTAKKIALAWALTLPGSALVSGALFYALSRYL